MSPSGPRYDKGVRILANIAFRRRWRALGLISRAECLLLGDLRGGYGL